MGGGGAGCWRLCKIQGSESGMRSSRFPSGVQQNKFRIQDSTPPNYIPFSYRHAGMLVATEAGEAVWTFQSETFIVSTKLVLENLDEYARIDCKSHQLIKGPPAGPPYLSGITSTTHCQPVPVRPQVRCFTSQQGRPAVCQSTGPGGDEL